MPKLKQSEWDPLSNGVYRVSTPKKSFLAVSRSRGANWFSKKMLGVAKERDGYLFFEEPFASNLAVYASENFATAALPGLSPAEISRARIEARKRVKDNCERPEEYLEPRPPKDLTSLGY